MTAAAVFAPAVHRSRKLIPEFRLHRPRSAAVAVELRNAAGSGAAFMAGGVDLINRMKFGGPVGDVIHLGGIAGLDAIEAVEGGLRFGSLVTHDRLATSPLVRSLLPELALTWPDVANIRIRCKGTVGGNIMARDPAYDFALAVMAAAGRLEFLAADGSPQDVAATAPDGIAGDGLLTHITVPAAASCRLVFDRSLRPIVTLALGLDLNHGRIAGGRLAIGCAYAEPIVVPLPIAEPAAPRELAENAESLARGVALRLPEPIGDRHAGAQYRRRMIGLLLRRNLSALA